MKTLVDARLREEARRLLFLFRCDDCAAFDPTRERCAHGYPTEPHRRTLDADEIVFCKEFDAGP